MNAPSLICLADTSYKMELKRVLSLAIDDSHSVWNTWRQRAELTRPHEVWCISNYSAIPLTLSGGVNQFTWSHVPRETSMTSLQAIPVVMNIMTTVNVTRKHAIAWDMGSTEKTCINYAGTLSWNANNYNSKTLEELAWIPQQGLDQTKEIRKSSTAT